MINNQIPRIRIEPPRVDTDGKGAAMLMEAYGVELDPWQRLVLDAWLGKDINGNYTAISMGISASRQNGKNCLVEAREFYGLAVNGEHILHTAHQLKTARASFRRLEAIFTDKRHPEITSLVKNIRHGMGEESIELVNGGMIEFASRSRQSARGYAGISLIVLDEAQELMDEQMANLTSVLSASSTGTRQIIYLGTPPYYGCAGEVFKRFRESCLLSAENNAVKSSCWHEWSPEGETLQDIDTNNKELWMQCNPAYGKRLTEDFTAEEHKTLSEADFARERLGFWMRDIVEEDVLAIPEELWEKCKSMDPKPDGKTAFGVKFNSDGTEVALAGAVIPENGKARITLLAVESTSRGVTWLAQWLNARYKTASCVVIDGRNGSDVLIEKLRPFGGGTWALNTSVIKPNAQNVVTAANMLLNDLNEGTLTWYEEQEALKISATTSIKRKIGSGWGFGGQASIAIEATSLALWGCKTSKRNPRKVMKIG